ncbi:hypothetical protein [Bosea sp. (in: a-proteobacteria)]|uniref:hypothetical protein n=1 Tax=Bosea sp. (in: a-proteobacteria) TaxID=1871050 RepID=UPI0027375CFC|nr:hypothetical protein [Bosea sp. (in: a-proteobacteria)]MDP3408093.1 hypothetical protein [Bosea sp. (in: a-proteobacteria)]
MAGLAQMCAYIAVGAFAFPLRPAMVATMMARPAMYAFAALMIAPTGLALVLAAIVALECLVEDVADKLFTGEFRWESDIHD